MSSSPAGAGAQPGEWTRSVLARVKAERSGWQQSLAGLVASHADVMETRSVETPGAEPAALPPESGGPPTAPRSFRGDAPAAWSFESFTSLSRGGGGETPDHRDPVAPGAQQAASEAARPASGMAAFARGRRAGACLHHILEQCDFSNLEAADLRLRIGEALRRHGLDDPSRHGIAHRPATPADAAFEPVEVVRDLLHRLAAAPLPGTGFSLSAVARDRCLVEWRFVTPLARTAPRRLADVFASRARGAVRQDYAGKLLELGAEQVRGYLSGFVDLIFVHRGRWYVVDWKSNDLGSAPTAYAEDALWQTMCHHHYVLQYHLYLLALHRHLRRRLPGYDYERHIAGAFYPFLRGLDSEDTARGWYVDRPPRELIAALDERVAGRAAA